MKRLWKVAKVLLFIFLFLVVVGSGFVVALIMTKDQELKVAQEAAYEVVTSIMSSKDRQREVGMPQGVELIDTDPEDIDILFRTWQFWYDCKPEGVLLLEFFPKRGIWIFHLFNRKKDLELITAKYIK